MTHPTPFSLFANPSDTADYLAQLFEEFREKKHRLPATHKAGRPGLAVERYFTRPGVHPFDEIQWERRSATITAEDGKVIFEQKDVEVPTTWTQLATNVVVSKYFRGTPGTPDRETSIKQLIDRVSRTITGWGIKDGYFQTLDAAETFYAELTFILVNQYACFNSPVWFNVGVEPHPQGSACQPYHARVMTVHGPMAIGDIVEKRMIGLPVYDGDGLAQIVAVKHNGVKPVFRIELNDGFSVEATSDHLVCAHENRRTGRLEWRRVDQLEVGMVMRVYPHTAQTITPPGDSKEVAEAALAGWLQADGFVGYEKGTNRSLTIEFMTNGREEFDWVTQYLDVVFPNAHSNTRDVETRENNGDLKRIRLYGEHLRPFVEKYALMRRGTEIRVPDAIFKASNDAAAAYIKSVFQSDGYATQHGESSARVAMAVISPDWVRDLQVLLTRFGIYSRSKLKTEKRDDRFDLHELAIAIRSERRQFERKIGFISENKRRRLRESLDLDGKDCPDVRYPEIVAIRPIGEMDVFDIQTTSGMYLSEGVLVHNCFINSVEDTMESILELAKTEGMLFKYGSGAGVNLSTIRSSKEKLTSGGHASGPVSFMRGYDAFAGVIKCVTGDTLVWTEEQGGVPIVEAKGKIATGKGFAEIAEFHENTAKTVRVVELSYTGLQLRGTGNHPVLTFTAEGLAWKNLDELQPGDAVAVGRGYWPHKLADAAVPYTSTINEAYRKKHYVIPEKMSPALGLVLGLLVAEGSIDATRVRLTHADRDTIDAFVEAWEQVFGYRPEPRFEAAKNTYEVASHAIDIVRFLRHLGIASPASEKCVPDAIFRSSRATAEAFVRGYFDGDGCNSRTVFAVSASKRLRDQMQQLLLALGYVSAAYTTTHGYFGVRMGGETAQRFRDQIGFVCARKNQWHDAADRDTNTNIDVIPGLVSAVRQRSTGNGWYDTPSGKKLLHFGFFNRAGDNVSIQWLREHPQAIDNLAEVAPTLHAAVVETLEFGYFWDRVGRASDGDEEVTFDITVPGNHCFIGNGIICHNSGGKTRRAAKMQILNADHPDVMDFVNAKPSEEKKAWALIEQGYDPSFNGEAYGSVFFQNANLSVRATDDFMRAVENDALWPLKAVNAKKGHPREVISTVRARDLIRGIADGTWICGDPGMQFHDTINAWNPCLNSGPIVASNPCSEYMFLNDTACNLSSINLLKYKKPGRDFDHDGFLRTVRTMITAMDIIVDNASYPTPKITQNSFDYRPLGLGYANLGALLMSYGMPYDSDEGRAVAGCITALMTGEAYHMSAELAERIGPFKYYEHNRDQFLHVIDKHRGACESLAAEIKNHNYDVPEGLVRASLASWDGAYDHGKLHGIRNAQATVLAPTGCLVGNSLIVTDRGLVRLETLGNPSGERWQEVAFRVATDDGPQMATRFYINGVERTRRIRTEAGYAIQGTHKHRVKIVDATTGDWVWRRFDELKPGDVVPLAMNNLIGKPRSVELPPLGELYWTADHATEAPRELTPELAELVGYFMGDGSLHAKGLRLCVTTGDADVVERLTHLVRTLFGLPVQITTKEGYTEVAVNSVPLTIWWDACGFSKVKPTADHVGKGWQPRIPDAVLYSNDPAIYGAFLRGLFEADGTVIEGVPAICTAAATFADEIKTLMLALGYPTTSKVDQSGFGQSDVHVMRVRNRSYNPAFRDQIGFISERKNARLAEPVGALSGKRDYVYLDSDLVDQLVPVGSCHHNAVQQSIRRHGAIPRQRAAQIFTDTGDTRLGEALGYFYDVIESNDDGGDQPTYDLSVPANVTYTANGFISHNTIAFMMDCDTTGIEPDIALIKYKRLVGGGMLKIVNNTVPEALRNLGYDVRQVEAIQQYIDEHETIEGAPELKDAHLPVFDCAFKPMNGVRSIHYMGHLRMMAACQPFISGAISKTINMPQHATVEEIERAYIEAWHLGLKAVAIYRDGSKRTQPLSTNGKDKDGIAKKDASSAASEIIYKPIRRHLPDERQSITHKFSIAGHEGYITVGMFHDGQPGEIFVKMAKEGSVVSGLVDAFATATSIMLQYGVPLDVLVNKFSHSRFEPAGFTNNRQIPIAKSILDYIFRWLALKFLQTDDHGNLIAATATIAPTPAKATVVTTATTSTPARLPGAASSTTGEPAGTKSTRDIAFHGYHEVKDDGKSKPAATPPTASNGSANGSANRSNGNGNGSHETENPLAAFTEHAGTADRSAATFQAQSDSPPCPSCGSMMVRNGSCYKCINCGTTSGCS